ncbi:MAG: cellulase family glycosylhydrolase [Clostridia bacterium]|nr:cellulase family glycosylhydrolase [Clostridia bacterium]
MTNTVTWNGFQHGINLGGWFSQCDYSAERFDTFIVKTDICRIAEWGLDHIRLPIDYNLVQNEDGTFRESGFQYIEKVIRWCKEYHLRMVLDLHKTRGFSFDEGEAQTGFFQNRDLQECFYLLWEELAKRFAVYRDMLAFELLNEVTERAYGVVWNRIVHECIMRIRRYAPDIPILVGGYWNNSIEALADLEEPYDQYVVYNFHCYDPIIFTHQGAPWVSGMNNAFRISIDEPASTLKAATEEFMKKEAHDFDGLDLTKPLGADYFMHRFEKAVQIARQRHVKLYCGEYGVIDRTMPEDQLKWYSAIHASFEAFGIGRAAWSYREMDFGISDQRLDPIRERLLALL